MLNQVMLVGRIKKISKLKEGYADITLAVQKQYKNIDGIYETDFIPCRLYGNIGSNTIEYCKNGDIVGIKGKLESLDNTLNVIVEKVTFLSSKKPKEDE